MSTYTLLYGKQTGSKHLLHSIGKSAQYSAIAYIRKDSEKNGYMDIYIYINCFTLLHA